MVTFPASELQRPASVGSSPVEGRIFSRISSDVHDKFSVQGDTHNAKTPDWTRTTAGGERGVHHNRLSRVFGFSAVCPLMKKRNKDGYKSVAASRVGDPAHI